MDMTRLPTLRTSIIDFRSISIILFSPSWEPSSGIEPTCERLLNSFWEHVGPEKRQYSGIRYQVVAEKDWIGK